jgi:hypothetical protein
MGSILPDRRQQAYQSSARDQDSIGARHRLREAPIALETGQPVDLNRKSSLSFLSFQTRS